jgi:hypothetical protein
VIGAVHRPFEWSLGQAKSGSSGVQHPAALRVVCILLAYTSVLS